MKDYIEPAFPSPRWEGWGSPQEGMTLRDYFAAKAMLGILSFKDIDEYSTKEVAMVAYAQADAMLKARNS
jgi:hypothetical protein